MGTKQAIIEIVNDLPDEILEDLLHLLKQVEKEQPVKMKLSINMRRILLEDKEVLSKLAK